MMIIIYVPFDLYICMGLMPIWNAVLCQCCIARSFCCSAVTLHGIYAMALVSWPYILKTINSIWNHHNIYFTVVSYNIPTHTRAREQTHTDWNWLLISRFFLVLLLSFHNSAMYHLFSTLKWFDIIYCWILRACMSVCVYVLLLLLYVYHYEMNEYTS